MEASGTLSKRTRRRSLRLRQDCTWSVFIVYSPEARGLGQRSRAWCEPELELELDDAFEVVSAPRPLHAKEVVRARVRQILHLERGAERAEAGDDVGQSRRVQKLGVDDELVVGTPGALPTAKEVVNVG